MSLQRLTSTFIALACVVGAVVVLTATSHGVGLSPDSLQYLAAGESVSAGHGLTTYSWDGEAIPLTHFPPGYPLMLATARAIGWSPEGFARWANVGFFVLTIVLAALLARRIAPHSSWVGPAGAVGFVVAHDLVVVHSMAWSEPAYLTLTLGGLLALAIALDRQQPRYLVLAMLGTAGAVLVRYVGLANVAVLGLAVLLWWPGSLWRRVLTSALVSLGALTPLLAVLARNATRHGQAGSAVANRHLGWYPLTTSDLREGASVVSKWVMPSNDASIETGVWLLFFAALVAIVIAGRSRTPAVGRPDSRLAAVLVLFAAMYFAVFVAAMTLGDAQTEFESRHLTPIFATIIILGIGWLARQTRRESRVRFAAVALIVLALAANLARLLPWLRDAQAHGLALRRVEHDAMALLQRTRQLPSTAMLYSNDPYFMRLQAARMVPGLPRQVDPNSLRLNPRFEQQVQAICDSAATRPTFLILFDLPMSPDPTATAEIAERGGDIELLPGGVLVKVRPHCAGTASARPLRGSGSSRAGA